ncbi:MULTISPECIES: MFS transporter [Agrobacterium]|uniref:Arabinose efflux permease family protein n=1 Tax=Agrobacterium deltaense Zutra 3/1 TaxID=1183427 RepID=A0A1S7NYS6_9HYPH|nr:MULTISPECIES: MFS transporter [Agrobacterium]NTB96773.1 MHS family MFS transporter [Agrobacterium tumefaciens]NTC47701.1 MHS family MFS transporter [Agrobacterium tumefaciens]UXT22839.1 MHS family MFS transporter [Agrobacterium tumefaciens]UXT41430.1 MHS family MFS transporter [Agrobacterium tumefaciens]CUX13441.1 Arabinose efflux permease family protein [Agrobacterium deltaense Zutra 3/1]
MSPTTTPAAARPLNGQDYRTLGLSALGGALEFYDFIIFVFFATVIGHLFFPPEMPDWLVMIQTFGIFAAGYLVRPLGGIVLAHYGDRYGRKRVFAFSILLMALSTLGMALMPTYATIGVAAPILLIILRMLQGAAIGGEVPGAWTFVAEHVPFRRVGLACGFLTSGLSFGIMLGSLIAFAINSLFTPEDVAGYAWRIPFLLGGIFGLIAVYLRRWLEETPIFTEMKKSKSLTDKLPLGLVLKHHMRGVVISALLTWVLSAAIVVTTLMTATFLQKLYGYTPTQALAGTSFGTLFLIFGVIIAGALIDRVGSGIFFMGASIFFGIATFTFYSYAGTSLQTMFVLYGVMGLSVGMAGAVPYVMVRAFPASVRFSGLSFAYNVSYAVFGGLTPIGVTTALAVNPMAHAWYLVFIAVLAFAIGLYLYLRGSEVESHVGIEELAALRS